MSVLKKCCAAVAVTLSVISFSQAQAEEEKVLNVYNWSDYIAADTLERFTKETGITVNYDVYDSNEMLEAKLMAGKSGYDVVFPTALPFVANQIKAGIYLPLDETNLPNMANIEDGVAASLNKADPELLKHSVPYMIAGTGVAYNVDKVNELAPGAPVDSWSLIFDPEWAKKLSSCGISLLDDPTEVFAAAMVYLGKDPKSEDPADLKAASAAIEAIRPYVRYFHSSTNINDMANGDLCVSHGYGGDMIQARDRAIEANNGVNVVVFLPKEGAQVVIDVMAIPADAPHPENAKKFIDFMMRADVVGPITDAVGYANAIKGSTEFVSKERQADPVIYPSEETRNAFFSLPPKSRGYMRQMTREWTRLKTNQ